MKKKPRCRYCWRPAQVGALCLDHAIEAVTLVAFRRAWDRNYALLHPPTITSRLGRVT